ncbi:MAG: hypothetical protein KJ658_18845, partial [Proteobacteria bacterium]|nr:hypothetical protein [Pseudomonadota bacterium]
MIKLNQPVLMELQADMAWIPLVQAVVEQGAPVLGLDRSKTLRLTMAVEEIVSHLARTALGTKIGFSLKPYGWHVLAEFSFRADPSHLWAMNLAAKPNLSDPNDLDHLGLLLASRMVDGFTLHLEGEVVHLALRQDCSYPVVTKIAADPIRSKGKLTIVPAPESAFIQAACVRAVNLYPARKNHTAFSMPGKVADMVAQKDMDMALVLDETSALAGMICWQALSEKGIGFFGPYVFCREEQAAALLTEHLIQRVARTKAMGLFSELATPELTTKEFESLGHFSYVQSDGQASREEVWYRHLGEDMGASVWAHPAMVSFLSAAYGRLVLMRDIRETCGFGEALPRRSVFSTQLRPELGEATLMPMVTGADAKDCVARHVDTLCRENFSNIF